MKKIISLFIFGSVLFGVLCISVMTIVGNDDLLVETTKEDDRVMIEAYYHSNGTAAVKADGYHAIQYTYDDKGRKISDIYCGIDMQPVEISYGYCGFKREYDNRGRVIKIIYFDHDDNIVDNSKGYAEIRRSYDDDQNTRTDMYYSANGVQARAVSGEYGIMKQYDEKGNSVEERCLDKNGNFANNFEGRGITKKEYDAEGVLVREMYYTATGIPVSMGRMNYGKEYRDGKTFYLDKNGKRLIRFDNFFNAHQEVVFLAGIAFIIIALFAKERTKIIMIAAYLFFVCIMTLWYRGNAASGARLEVFWSYRQIFVNDDIRREIVNNIWLFIPLGALVYDRCAGRKVLLVPIITSAIIEILQYIMHIGYTEIDDIISNAIGGIIGYCLMDYIQSSAIINKISPPRLNKSN
ncbi:MAG: VanZ family protein [Butyrivibrio sp.]|nr:VanZ family protein [Butyrivibrio sp.]